MVQIDYFYMTFKIILTKDSTLKLPRRKYNSEIVNFKDIIISEYEFGHDRKIIKIKNQ